MLDQKNPLETPKAQEETKPISDMGKIYEQTLVDIREGSITKGTIISVSKKEVVVDVGYKSEGILSIDEFQNPSEVKVGDEVDVLVESKEDDDGMIVLSKEKADRLIGCDLSRHSSPLMPPSLSCRTFSSHPARPSTARSRLGSSRGGWSRLTARPS